MKHTEFESWLRYHVAAFPGMGKFLGGLKRADQPRGEFEPCREDVVGSWYRALRDTDLDDAKLATDRMKAGDEEEPKGFDRHPTAIAQIAARHRQHLGEDRPLYVDGQQTVACPLCLESGGVLVWSARAVKAAQNGDRIPTGRSGLAITRCTCRFGEKFRDLKRMAPFDPERCLPTKPCLQDEADEQDRLREFAANIRPSNYETAFDNVS